MTNVEDDWKQGYWNCITHNDNHYQLPESYWHIWIIFMKFYLLFTRLNNTSILLLKHSMFHMLNGGKYTYYNNLHAKFR